MKTRLYRNHYGYNAETVIDKMEYHTMRVHSGAIVTSIHLIMSEKDGVRIASPLGSELSRSHPPVKRLTPQLLRSIHEKHVKEMTEGELSF